MTSIGVFPFGQPVQEVVQVDRTQKRIFVLGVYASAVHARWVSEDNKTIVNALAVASEPSIFWRGDNAESVIEKIAVPPKLGHLVPANRQYNGPSGRALDDFILKPLGLSRADTWLCDLVPHSCVNLAQSKAIENKYFSVAQDYGLPKPTALPVPTILTDEKRRNAICDEIQESGASILILLGDKPIQWFLKYFDPQWKRLADFTRAGQPYGKLHATQIKGRHMDVLPLAHPRQIAKLGQSSLVWHNRHRDWIDKYASRALNS